MRPEDVIAKPVEMDEALFEHLSRIFPNPREFQVVVVTLDESFITTIKRLEPWTSRQLKDDFGVPLMLATMIVAAWANMPEKNSER